ncbi:MAG: MopE-related protein [Myxococcota bacterium]
MLHVCPACKCHVRATDAACPHCGASTAVARSPSRPIALSLIGLALGGCVSMYGVIVTKDEGLGDEDADADGWLLSEGDCDDDDDTIHPEAEETPGDGVDSNCDEADDT